MTPKGMAEGNLAGPTATDSTWDELWSEQYGSSLQKDRQESLFLNVYPGKWIVKAPSLWNVSLFPGIQKFHPGLLIVEERCAGAERAEWRKGFHELLSQTPSSWNIDGPLSDQAVSQANRTLGIAIRSHLS
ncbi:hypothetical protein [Deinococcus altitudinis]|uniref:hypothetical protein n=1 Tax=Deinococcus altitudinis TaxID=468914 RepID=UPI0038914A2C